MIPSPTIARPFDYGQVLYLVAPELLLVLTALFVMAADMLVLRHRPLRTRFTAACLLAVLGCIAAILQIAASSAASNLSGGMLLTNPLVHAVQISILAITIAILLLSASSRFTHHVGEYILLILAATCGMMFLAATEDLLVIFLSLELLSLSLYILAAFDKRGARAWEAALKYFLFGGMSAGFLLFGFSFLYGISNSTSLRDIAHATAASHTLNPLLAVAIVTIAIGLGFKIAAAPLHFWAPDVYEGAPAPSAALIASGSKVASFFLLFQIAALGLVPAAGSAALRHPARGWVAVLAILSVASMLVGNLGALRQLSLRRLVAYSAVAHAGYMLVGICAHTADSLSALLYYVITYALATIGVFAVISAVEEDSGSDLLSALAGLSRRSPVLAGSLAVFILSLAGIPPLAGFLGKFYLFVAALEVSSGSTPLLWLVILAIAFSCVSLYYYLQVLKHAYVAPAPEDTGALHSPLLTRLLAVALALAVVVLGCAPHLLLDWLNAAIAAAGL
jgi:NADH-quinone oxidoreductase subunit N